MKSNFCKKWILNPIWILLTMMVIGVILYKNKFTRENREYKTLIHTVENCRDSAEYYLQLTKSEKDPIKRSMYVDSTLYYMHTTVVVLSNYYTR